MALQTQVNMGLCYGVPGQKATPTQAVYTPVNYLAAEGGVAAGGFCFAGEKANLAYNSGSTIIGFVERVISVPLLENEAGTLIAPEGCGLTVAVKGDYWVKAPASVEIGGAVYCDESGAIAESGTDTGWVYATAADADEPAIISNWGASASSGSGSGNQPG